MNESESPVVEQPSPKSRRYPEVFKRDAVRLVTDEKYSFKAAAQAVGVSEKSLRDWHKKFAPPPVPCGEDATVSELQTALSNNYLKTSIEVLGMEYPTLFTEIEDGSKGKTDLQSYQLEKIQRIARVSW